MGRSRIYQGIIWRKKCGRGVDVAGFVPGVKADGGCE